jgi:hypothetical protein
VQVLITINDAFVPSVGAARKAYNATLSATVTVDANGNQLPPGQTLPNPALINDDVSFVQFQNGELCKGWLAKYGALPAPVIINGVPQSVPRRKGIQALIDKTDANGVRYFDKVQPAIDAITDPQQKATMQNEWDNSQDFDRQRPSLIQMAVAIGITDPAVDPKPLDDLFVYADSLA